MLANPDYNNISIDKYKQKDFRHLCYHYVFPERRSISGSNIQHSMLTFHDKKSFKKNEILRDIANKYVSIFGQYLQFWRMMYIWVI